MSEKKYYKVTFMYDGPFSDMPGVLTEEGERVIGEHDRACLAADAASDAILRDARLEFRHGFAWPDGTLYKYVCTTLDLSELSRLLTGLDRQGTRVTSVRTEQPDFNPHSNWGKTLTAYFTEAAACFEYP